jgi:transcriptional regulator with XRE-family HTH domain
VAGEFGDRLKAAAMAFGIAVPDMPVRLGKMAGISPRTASRYLKLDKADLSADTAHKLARGLHVRAGWLITGELPMAHRPEGTEALAILEQLSPSDAAKFLVYGRNLVRRSM